MKTTKVNKKTVKAIENDFSKVMLSPFNVLNYINKNRSNKLETGETIQDVLNTIGVKGKLQLNNLYNYVDGYGRETIAKLETYKKHGYRLPGNALGLVDVCGVYYVALPLRYTLNDFFASINSVVEIQNAEAKKEERYNKVWEKITQAEYKEVARKEKALNKQRESDIKSLVNALKKVPANTLLTAEELREKAVELYNTKAA